MKTPWLYKANEIKHWASDKSVNFNGKKIRIPKRAYTLNGLNIVQRFMNAWGVFTGKYDALDWQENLTEDKAN